MKENTRLLVARRRNLHKREGNKFIQELSKVTNTPFSEYSLLEPQYSIELEQKINRITREGFQSGFIKKICHLSMEELLKRLSQAYFVSKYSEEEIDLLFCNYEDFSIRCKLGTILMALSQYLAFDRDTITIVHRKGQSGMMVDVETETVDSNCYELDVWGEWQI